MCVCVCACVPYVRVGGWVKSVKPFEVVANSRGTGWLMRSGLAFLSLP